MRRTKSVLVLGLAAAVVGALSGFAAYDRTSVRVTSGGLNCLVIPALGVFAAAWYVLLWRREARAEGAGSEPADRGELPGPRALIGILVGGWFLGGAVGMILRAVFGP